MKRLYVITGGTLVHISPHFSLCAPAYGSVGTDIANRLSRVLKPQGHAQQCHDIHVIKTKMAGRPECETANHLQALGLPPSPETNHDLKQTVDILLQQSETTAIVMAAAICDFEPLELIATSDLGTTTLRDFGKDQPRLHHVQSLTLRLRPSDKLIDSIKRTRPDIFLVTFKTTAGVSADETFAQALYNLRRSKSDLVFANDIQYHQNMVVTASEERLQGMNRTQTLALLCERISREVIDDYH